MTSKSASENAKRRGHGDDSIYFDRSKNCWVGAISHGFTPSGKRRRPKVYGKDKTEVRDKLKELRKELATGVKSAARYSVEDAVTDWLARGLKGRHQNTREKNRHLAEQHVIPSIGKIKLKELTADDIDDWLDSKTEVLATRTIKDCLAVLRRSITQAQRRDKIGRNVAELVTPPDGKVGRPSKALTLEQAEAVLAAANGTRLHAYVVVSLLIGIRTEEARAMTWDHVALNAETPHVMVWRSVREGGDTKTRKSRRTLALPPQAVEVLEAQRSKQDAERKAAGKQWIEHNLVFSSG